MTGHPFVMSRDVGIHIVVQRLSGGSGRECILGGGRTSEEGRTSEVAEVTGG